MMPRLQRALAWFWEAACVLRGDAIAATLQKDAVENLLEPVQGPARVPRHAAPLGEADAERELRLRRALRGRVLEPLDGLRRVSLKTPALVQTNSVGEHGLDVAAPCRRFVQARRLGVVAARAPSQFVGQAELVLDAGDVLALGPRDE
jgi:hypothetical protein